MNNDDEVQNYEKYKVNNLINRVFSKKFTKEILSIFICLGVAYFFVVYRLPLADSTEQSTCKVKASVLANELYYFNEITNKKEFRPNQDKFTAQELGNYKDGKKLFIKMKGPFNGSIYFDGDADSYYKYENMFLEYLESSGLIFDELAPLEKEIYRFEFLVKEKNENALYQCKAWLDILNDKRGALRKLLS